jgi:hypothetical protein
MATVPESATIVKEHAISRRVARLRPLKQFFGEYGVPLAVLDLILPPVPCRRTRLRSRRLARGQSDLPNRSFR